MPKPMHARRLPEMVNATDITVWARGNLQQRKGARALVTGGASGIGLSVARGLGALGAEVCIADINTEGGEAAVSALRAEWPDTRFSFARLDLADPESVAAFCDGFDVSALDILVNNAGILPPLRRRETPGGQEIGFAISVLGHFALTAGLLDRLETAEAPRVVWLSSLVHRRGTMRLDDLACRDYEAQNAYNQAKIASLMLALECEARARAAGAKLVSLAAHPGVARTAIGHSRDGQRRENLHDRLTDFAFLAAMKLLGQPAEVGARAVLQAAVDPQLPGGSLFGPGGLGETRGAPRRLTPTAVACDTQARTRLWDYCRDVTGIEFDWKLIEGRAA